MKTSDKNTFIKIKIHIHIEMNLQIMKNFNKLFLLFFFAVQLSAQITPGEGKNK